MTIVRRLPLLLGLAASVALLLPAAPVHAAGQIMVVCVEVGDDDDDLEIWDCFQILVPELGAQPPGPVECLTCPPGIDIRTGLDVQRRPAFSEQLGQGLRLLGEEALAEDPAEAQQLRAQATQSFLAGTEILGGSGIELDRVGWFDPEQNGLYEDPTPVPMLEAAGQHLVEGFIEMGDPSPQPAIQAGMAHFDQAYAALAELYAD